MALEVMNGIANTAVEKVMSVGLTVEKTSSIGIVSLAIAVVVGVALSAWLYSLRSGK